MNLSLFIASLLVFSASGCVPSKPRARTTTTTTTTKAPLVTNGRPDDVTTTEETSVTNGIPDDESTTEIPKIEHTGDFTMKVSPAASWTFNLDDIKRGDDQQVSQTEAIKVINKNIEEAISKVDANFANAKVSVENTAAIEAVITTATGANMDECEEKGGVKLRVILEGKTLTSQCDDQDKVIAYVPNEIKGQITLSANENQDVEEILKTGPTATLKALNVEMQDWKFTIPKDE